MVKEKKNLVEVEEEDVRAAARAMGRKGGTIRSEKKLASAKANILKAIGKKKGKKYPGMFDPERIIARKSQKGKRYTPAELTAQAKALGRKGGKVKSERKAISSRLNAVGGPDGTGKRAGRKKKYHYTKRLPALIGVNIRRPCIIPDEVGANMKKYAGKTFSAMAQYPDGTEKKANVRMVRRDEKTGLWILTQFYTT